ncbi:hemolysin family protein [Lutimaribacter sp. EGI FJ00015]|uniref:Hemolysin family protein n=1 Tax=Lutimaribacter degradans TaxID=2945989 RepID=A0ACC5ZXG2_9RHOB|nr:hemolysin family protein [Lutimaribacter sp. EGI FJ00013]MCM2563021.1 hemolysin family protein [Lutimaribacter sp. EGI FJ00013]MCO0614189.1 hemolysin family protein [Lutimaribacter sp. EGI FJ00015]MCO0636166.1 hemolysin family protein [Lutimaribacter sp. EGI FJ00014]
MGESTEGSSTAAHSAQPIEAKTHDPVAETNGNFFTRIIGALGASDVEDTFRDSHAHSQTASPSLSNLRNMRVEDVAVPKADIVSVPCSISRDELVEQFRETGLTRLPVYEGTLDNPQGMIHLKDFALKHGFNGKGGSFALKDMLRPLLYVPPSMTIGVLLQKMQTERKHMALVIDEYGGVDGLVTIEDLIEQVIGEIEDEHDTEDDSFWTAEKDGQYLALAKTPLAEFEAEIGQSLTDTEDVDEEEIDTLGGLVFMLSGRVPVRGEVVKHPAGPEFEVVEADPRRIKRLRVRLDGSSAS